VDLIAQFISQYTKEYDFYDKAARLAAQTIEAHLQAAGIRSMVTARAKSISRLEAKCRQRESRRGGYATIEEIVDDIVDLAGVRVALYFPAERDQVDGLITRLFKQVTPKKDFPVSSEPVRDGSRFSGYSASHYRAQLKEEELGDSEKRYAAARIEVQVASVLMHAWAEVEHDLIYKPLAGDLSEEEYAILDQLNGLVIAGEIGLERLQKAGETRIGNSGRQFANHYDLAVYLLGRAASISDKPISESGLGRVDLLHDMIIRLGITTPRLLKRYLEALHDNFEIRPLAEQVIDALLIEDPARYDLYRAVRAQRPWLSAEQGSGDAQSYTQVGFFMAKWIELEALLRGSVPAKRPHGVVVPFGKDLARLGLLDESMAFEFDRLRRMRNNLVHGIEAPASDELEDAVRRIDAILAEILRRLNER
jgi:ppGpp synthetase/RelA/SpoT-type nucleotidyltranferase